MMREGPFYPGSGLERIVNYHERQDERYVQAALETSVRWNKPIMLATELAGADPSNVGPAMVRSHGSFCFPSGARAIRALGEMVKYAQFLARKK
jgi:acetyltransferase